MAGKCRPLLWFHFIAKRIWVVPFGYSFQVHSFNVPTYAGHLLWGQIWESLLFRLHSKFGQIHLSIDHHSCFVHQCTIRSLCMVMIKMEAGVTPIRYIYLHHSSTMLVKSFAHLKICIGVRFSSPGK